MTQKELQKKYKNKKVRINFDKLFGESFAYENYYQNSVDEDGKIITSEYNLSSGIIFEADIINCMMIDPENWKEELEEFPFRFDETTLKFFDNLSKELWYWRCETVGYDTKQEEVDKVKFYMPIQQEWYLWNIMILINEIHKYLFKKPLYDALDSIIEDKENEGFMKWLMDIKKVRKCLNNTCNDILEITND